MVFLLQPNTGVGWFQQTDRPVKEILFQFKYRTKVITSLTTVSKLKNKMSTIYGI